MALVSHWFRRRRSTEATWPPSLRDIPPATLTLIADDGEPMSATITATVTIRDMAAKIDGATFIATRDAYCSHVLVDWHPEPHKRGSAFDVNQWEVSLIRGRFSAGGVLTLYGLALFEVV